MTDNEPVIGEYRPLPVPQYGRRRIRRYELDEFFADVRRERDSIFDLMDPLMTQAKKFLQVDKHHIFAVFLFKNNKAVNVVSAMLEDRASKFAFARELASQVAAGRPITSRRYDHLWTRLGQHLPWVATQQISTHWLRHTTLTWVERNFGHAIAHAYAGHTDHHDRGATATYVRAGLPEIAAALTALTGEPHPLATDTD